GDEISGQRLAVEIFQPAKPRQHARTCGETETDSSAWNVASRTRLTFCSVASGSKHYDCGNEEAGPCTREYCNERQRAAQSGVAAGIKAPSLGPQTGALVGL